ncbi:hypothetical protein SAMN02910447_01904 [Ruminococcus sp. YE71]|uniref:hypothetical protein n=1 Tax=unclassified Ruminococcus TaxID=2608920 RepID=UPI00088821F2|nr:MULTISPECIES: hypothetical protein [unclassified Ruminococcus]SDA20673.1 hypothetical protein SAMN02910446_01766 [Ruminococcus sp. YE78]SFW33831.1 hypothetical protein SAMN02910447_01904 [Ruminococcus sp. YE71]
MDEFFPYRDIIGLPHHKSADRKPMSLSERAAQFSPFAALTGYDEIICETGRITKEQCELPDHVKDELDRRLALLTAMTAEGYRPTVTVTCFVPDKHKSGGCYENFTGELRKVDSTFRTLVFSDEKLDAAGRVIDIDMVSDIGCEIFD